MGRGSGFQKHAYALIASAKPVWTASIPFFGGEREETQLAMLAAVLGAGTMTTTQRIPGPAPETVVAAPIADRAPF